MYLPDYHRCLDRLHVNTLPPRAYFIPCASREEACLPREQSSSFSSLNGEWDFAYFESERDLPSEIEYRDRITVPGCWQNYLGRGYDPPAYTNLMYHFPCDPPHLPDAIPCGVYRRYFEVSSEQKQAFSQLVFEGVSAGFYLFINGSLVGYSQVSHCTSEFDISPFIHSGINEITVAVLKWSTGSYLEDQDMLRLSGIFRDVYILFRPLRHVSDIEISSVLSDDLKSARLGAKLSDADGLDVKYELYSPDGLRIAAGSGSECLSLDICEPVLWSSEAPNLYDLYIWVGDEVIRQRVGIRRFEISDRRVLINGREVKALGVNRHDCDPDTGYYLTPEKMLRDILLIKKSNINFIRTSHYPNDPRFAELCDEYGIMLCDEADIETHGMGYDYSDTWDWPRWSSLSDSPEWRESYIDRAARLYERDKNRAGVVLWSLGNESGVGENHKAMSDYIHSRDSGAIVHYENSHLEFKPNRPDISDVESRMYPSLDYCRSYLENPAYTKPLFLCEYLNSATTGGTHEHFDMIRRYPGFFGGCFWEFADHAVNDGGRLKYGGDFGEYPSDTIGCIDGVVFPDRTPHPGLYDLKKAYQEYEASYSDGRICIKSRREFASLDDLSLRWSVERDGAEIMSGSVGRLCIAPGGSAEYQLFENRDFSGPSVLRLVFEYASDKPWAGAGEENGFEEFILSDGMTKAQPASAGSLSVLDGERFLRVEAGQTRYVFDKLLGKLCHAKRNGFEVLSQPLSLQFFRAPTWNHMGFGKTQSECGIYRAQQKCYRCDISRSERDMLTVRAFVAFGRAPYPPFARGTVSYSFMATGELEISADIELRHNTPALGRAGIELHLPETFKNFRYLGYGPFETYPDRHLAGKLSAFEASVADNFVHYIRPQENSSHFGTRLASLDDGRIRLSATCGKPFSVCASQYTPEQLFDTLHDYELAPSGLSVLNIDPHMAPVDPSYGFISDKHIEYSIRINLSEL